MDIRYALRQFRKSPGFTSAAIFTLALGIGGTTAIFTLIDAVMLRSLPVADPATLYRIGEGGDCCVKGIPQGNWGMYSFRLVERLRAQAPEFEQIAAFQAGAGRVSVRRQGEQAARPLRSEYVSGNYFATFGVGALGGRVFTPNDDTPGAPPVAVLSHHAWETAYGANPSVVGSTFSIEGHAFAIVGVAPAGFFGETLRSDPPDIWIPLHQEPLIDGRDNLMSRQSAAWLRLIGRVRPGSSVGGVGTRLTGVLRQWILYEAGYAANWMPDIVKGIPKETIRVIPAGAGVEEMKESYAASLRILFAVCGMVLLIACANVANLLLVRSVDRRGQTALRLAVGATRRQIVTQALAESVLLAAGGGMAGLLVAMAAARLLISLAFSSARFLPIAVTPSLPVLGFACGASLLTGILFGAAPAWLATRTDPAEALRAQRRGGSDRSAPASRILLVAQAALSVVLVAGATMLGRSLYNLEHQDFGYEVPGRVIVSLNGPSVDYSSAKLNALYRQMEERLNSIAGVGGSGLALYNPLTNNWGEFIVVDGHPEGKLDGNSGASWDRVSADYLQNFGIRLLRGRYFSRADDERTAPVAIVNEAFVRRFFGRNESPLDRRFGMNLPQFSKMYRIIGVVRDAKFAGFALGRPARPMFYVPLAQMVTYNNEMMDGLERNSHSVRAAMLVTRIPPGTLEPILKKTLAELDPGLTVISVRTMEEQVALSFGRQRAVASLAGLFGTVALLLAAVGMYGVTAYSVARRTSEIGIRMALGAGRGAVVRMVLGGSAKRVAIGLLAGVPLSIGAGRLVEAELYGVSSWDPEALIVAAGALLACALIAAAIPAGRAASISPLRALRAE
ncbi:MAG TPA: ABC transporter permease [Bryobacteraceae bacterium]|nr:ABC transporter permease [Bryobacteraceae bacterium]